MQEDIDRVSIGLGRRVLELSSLGLSACASMQNNESEVSNPVIPQDYKTLKKIVSKFLNSHSKEATDLYGAVRAFRDIPLHETHTYNSKDLAGLEQEVGFEIGVTHRLGSLEFDVQPKDAKEGGVGLRFEITHGIFEQGTLASVKKYKCVGNYIHEKEFSDEQLNPEEYQSIASKLLYLVSNYVKKEQEASKQVNIDKLTTNSSNQKTEAVIADGNSQTPLKSGTIGDYWLPITLGTALLGSGLLYLAKKHIKKS